jgi:hypothetical protein
LYPAYCDLHFYFEKEGMQRKRRRRLNRKGSTENERRMETRMEGM